MTDKSFLAAAVRKWPEVVQAVIDKLQPALKDGKALHDRLFNPECAQPIPYVYGLGASLVMAGLMREPDIDMPEPETQPVRPYDFTYGWCVTPFPEGGIIVFRPRNDNTVIFAESYTLETIGM